MTGDLVYTILSRRSIRKYASERVKRSDLKRLLEITMAAPSASNRKPWHFIVVTDRRMLNSLAKAHPYGKMLFEAPMCIVVCGDPAISEQTWVQDCAAATENLLLAATAQDLGTVWVGVFPRDERINDVRKLLKIPETIVPLNLIPIGHAAEEKEPRTQYDKQKIHQECW